MEPRMEVIAGGKKISGRRSKYTDEQRREHAKSYRDGDADSRKDLAKELGVSKSTLAGWAMEFDGRGRKSKGKRVTRRKAAEPEAAQSSLFGTYRHVRALLGNLKPHDALALLDLLRSDLELAKDPK